MLRTLITLCLGFGSSLLFAYGPCDGDAKRLCDSGDYHAETEKNCLHFQAEKVEDGLCREFLQQGDSDWRKTVESFRLVQTTCKDALSSLCPELKGKDQQLKAQQTCLMAESGKLSSSCKNEVNRHIRSFQPQIHELK